MKRYVLFVLTISSAAYLYGQYYSGPNSETSTPQEYSPAQPNPNDSPTPTQGNVAPITELPDYAAEEFQYDGAVEEDTTYVVEDSYAGETTDYAGETTDYEDETTDYEDSYEQEDAGYTDLTPAEEKKAPLVDTTPNPVDPNTVKSIIIQLPFTNITLTPPYAPYQTYDVSRLKSGRIPQLASSKSLLQNLDKTIWRLKFYNHPDNASVESVVLIIKEPELFLTTTLTPAGTKLAPEHQLPANRVSSAKYRLTLVKSLRPGEGIYAYDTGTGVISFIYIRLIMPHLLAFDMGKDFETISKSPDKSLNDLGIFTLE